MRTIIYYFTGTGNSLNIAQQLKKQLENCKIESMVKKPPKQQVGGVDENIGFIFPVYYWGLPRIVKQFIEKLDIQNSTYIFAIVNYKGWKLDTLGLLDDVLRQSGGQLSYGEGIKFPGNYIINYNPPSSKKILEIISNANDKIDEIAKAVKKREIRPLKRLGTHISRWGNKLLYRNIEKFDAKFTATKKCTACGRCVEICPVQNIKLEVQKPVWQHNCEQCLACIQWCPQEAIEYGEKTVKRRRYQNPNIKVKDVIEGNQKK